MIAERTACIPDAKGIKQLAINAGFDENSQREVWRNALKVKHALSEDLFARGEGEDKVEVPAVTSLL